MRQLANSEPLNAAAQAENLKIFLIELDVQSESSIAAAVGTIEKQQGRLDILVNNAGHGFVKALEQADFEELHRAWMNRVLPWNWMLGLMRSMNFLKSWPTSSTCHGAKLASCNTTFCAIVNRRINLT